MILHKCVPTCSVTVSTSPATNDSSFGPPLSKSNNAFTYSTKHAHEVIHGTGVHIEQALSHIGTSAHTEALGG